MIYAQEELLPWTRAVLRRIEDVELFDAHVHLGIRDPAGLEVTEEEASAALEQVDSRGLIFPLKEPGGYEGPNRHMIELSQRHPERFKALCRLDPARDPMGEAQDCLAAGAVGLKLHPRGEGFSMDDPRLDEIFELADERRLPVMIHAGVGDVAIGAHTVERARRHPDARLILAHCAIGAFHQTVRHVHELPNLYYDTSWWNPADVWALLRLVPPGQILYASDVPFASPAEGIVITARLAIEAGLRPDQLRAVMGGQAQRLVEHDEPLDVGSAPEEVPALAPELERLYVTLCTAVEPMLRGEDPGQGLGLAQAACAEPVGPHADVIESIGALLELAEGAEEPDALRPLRRPGFDLVLAAAVLARTPAAGVPALEEVIEQVA